MIMCVFLGFESLSVYFVCWDHIGCWILFKNGTRSYQMVNELKFVGWWWWSESCKTLVHPLSTKSLNVKQQHQFPFKLWKQTRVCTHTQQLGCVYIWIQKNAQFLFLVSRVHMMLKVHKRGQSHCSFLFDVLLLPPHLLPSSPPPFLSLAHLCSILAHY